jgi:hypothetical protein
MPNLLGERLYRNNVLLDSLPCNGELSFASEIASLRALCMMAYENFSLKDADSINLLHRVLRACAVAFTDYTNLRREITGRAMYEHVIAAITRCFPRDIAVQFIQQTDYLIESTIFQSEDAIFAMDQSVPSPPDDAEAQQTQALCIAGELDEVESLLLAPVIPPPIPTKLNLNSAHKFLESFLRCSTVFFSAQEELIVARKMAQLTLMDLLAEWETSKKFSLPLLSCYLENIRLVFSFIRNSIHWNSRIPRTYGALNKCLPAGIRDGVIIHAVSQAASQLNLDIIDLNLFAKPSGPRMTNVLPDGSQSCDADTLHLPLDWNK